MPVYPHPPPTHPLLPLLRRTASTHPSASRSKFTRTIASNHGRVGPCLSRDKPALCRGEVTLSAVRLEFTSRDGQLGKRRWISLKGSRSWRFGGESSERFRRQKRAGMAGFFFFSSLSWLFEETGLLSSNLLLVKLVHYLNHWWTTEHWCFASFLQVFREIMKVEFFFFYYYRDSGGIL